jgi:transposase
MITPPPGTRVWLAVGVTDMRKGFDGLAMLVQEKLQRDPFGGQIFVFRGKRGYLLKALWWDGQGLCLFAKRLEKGRFVWPSPADGSVVLTTAQLAMLLEGIDWRMPVRTVLTQLRGPLLIRLPHLGRLRSGKTLTSLEYSKVKLAQPPVMLSGPLADLVEKLSVRRLGCRSGSRRLRDSRDLLTQMLRAA